MNLKLKYPQRFKKQHKKREQFPVNDLKRSVPSTNYLVIQSATQVILPNRFISYFRKLVKKFFKLKSIKCWFNVQPNKLISSKAKNSRMGKGVGSINRIGFKVSAHKPIIILANISPTRTNYLIKALNSRYPSMLYLCQL